MTIFTVQQAVDTLIFRGQFVEQIGGNRRRWRVNDQEMSVGELMQLARQLDGGEDKPSKYGNRRTVVDGIEFDSAAEAAEYIVLRRQEQAGEISELELQPRFLLLDGFVDFSGQRHAPIHYVADFAYQEQGRIVVEDYKGAVTDVYALKRKMFLHNYPHIVFREIKEGDRA